MEAQKSVSTFKDENIRQYNTNNGTNKELKKCLQNKDAQEMISLIASTGNVPPEGYSHITRKNNRIYCENVIEYKSFKISF